MIWDATVALAKIAHFFVTLLSNGYEIYPDAKSAYDSDVAPILTLLGETKDGLSKVGETIDALKDAKERLFIANREVCKEMAERVQLLQTTIETLIQAYKQQQPQTVSSSSSSSSSSNKTNSNLDGYITKLNADLAKVNTLIAANVLPLKAQTSWYERQKWILTQARNRDNVRADFVQLSQSIDESMQRLSSGLTVQTHVSVMALQPSSFLLQSSSELDRSELLEYQELFKEEIMQEMKSWTAEQKQQQLEMDDGFRSVLSQLEVNAAQTEEASPPHTLQHGIPVTVFSTTPQNEPFPPRPAAAAPVIPRWSDRPFLAYAQLPPTVGLLLLLAFPALYTALWLCIPLKQNDSDASVAAAVAAGASAIPPISLPVYLAAWRPYYGAMNCAVMLLYWQSFAVGDEMGSLLSSAFTAVCAWLFSYQLFDVGFQLLLSYRSNTLRQVYGIMNLLTLVGSASLALTGLLLAEVAKIGAQRKTEQRATAADATNKVASRTAEQLPLVEVVQLALLPAAAAVPSDFYSTCPHLPSSHRLRYLRLHRGLVGTSMAFIMLFGALWSQFFTYVFFQYSNRDSALTQILFSTAFTSSFTLIRAVSVRVARRCDKKVMEMNRFEWRQLYRHAAYEAKRTAANGRAYAWNTLPSRAHYSYHNYSSVLFVLFTSECFYFFFFRNLFIDFTSTAAFIGAELLRLTQDDLLRYWIPVLLDDHAQRLARDYPNVNRVIIRSKLFQLIVGQQSVLPQLPSAQQMEEETRQQQEADIEHARRCLDCQRCIQQTRAWEAAATAGGCSFAAPPLSAAPATSSSPWLISVDPSVWPLAVREEVTWRYGIRSLVGLSSLFSFVCTLSVLKRGPNRWFYPDIGQLPASQFEQLVYFSLVAIAMETANMILMEWHRTAYTGSRRAAPASASASAAAVHPDPAELTVAVAHEATTAVPVDPAAAASDFSAASIASYSSSSSSSSSSPAARSSVWSLTLRVLSYRSALLLALLAMITHIAMDVFITRLDFN